jgi:molybdopterin-guanine dinucleotide biosynthesis protein A
MSEGRIANASAALLLGGASKRMGGDKARLPLAGQPLAAHLAALLGRLFEEVLLVGGEAPEGTAGRSVADPEGPPCALRGLVGALQQARGERVVVVATDLPGLTPDLLLGLLALPEADAVVPRSDGRAHPMCAVYRREVVLPRAERRLAEGHLALSGLLEECNVGWLEGPDLAAIDPSGRALSNVNTPEEWVAFQASGPTEAPT